MIPQRQLSLDVFRGMTVALMIVANSLGSQDTYAQLLHAGWHGFTLTDLVFPTFLFVVGSAMSFSLDRYERQGGAAFHARVLKRTLVIFLAGYLMYWYPFDKPLGDTRVLGVLQRIALCYLLASLAIHYLKLRGALILVTFGDLSMSGNAGTRLFAVAWDLLLPINKKLWTGSYVLLTVGADLCLLAWLIVITDINGRKDWTYFFEVFGRNPLVIYVFSELLLVTLTRVPLGDGSLLGWLYTRAFQSWAGDRNGSPLFAIVFMFVCWAVGWFMDRRQTYVKA